MRRQWMRRQWMRRRIVGCLGADERGSVLAIVAICLVVFLGMAALAIDLGNLWAQRRSMITATDASALAAASYIQSDSTGLACQTAVTAGSASPAWTQAGDPYLTQNKSAAVLTPGGFVVTPYGGTCTSQAGQVQVQAQVPASLLFAPVLGSAHSTDVASTSVAEYGQLIAPSGLRPIGVCNTGDDFEDWLAYGAGLTPPTDPDLNPLYQALAGAYNPLIPTETYVAPSVYPGAQNTIGGIDVVSRFPAAKFVSNACGSAVGNWGWIDLSSTGPAGTSQLGTWLTSGYPGTVPPVDTLGSGPGNKLSGNPILSGLNTLLCPASTPTPKCLTFGIVVYNNVTGTGATTTYNEIGQVCVALRGFGQPSGATMATQLMAPLSNAGSPTDASFDFEFLAPNRCNLTGQIGVPTGSPQVTLQGITICAGNVAGTTALVGKCDA
jgi:Flp pilus assembly protein TadG